MKNTDRTREKEIQSWDEVPAFANEEEEDAFWGEHSLGDRLLAQIAKGPPDPDLPPPRPRTGAQPISVRVDADLLRRLKAVARERNIGYQTLLKQWLADRLAIEEARSEDPRGNVATPVHATAGREGTSRDAVDPETMSQYLATLLATVSEAAVLSVADAVSQMPLPSGFTTELHDHVRARGERIRVYTQALRTRLRAAAAEVFEATLAKG